MIDMSQAQEIAREFVSLVFSLLSILILILAISIAGVLLCTRYAYTRASVGMALFALLFTWHAVTAVVRYMGQRAYVESFEARQIGPTTWTAPVVHVDTAIPITLGVVLIACYLVGRRLPRRPVT